ncbi:hypothetical protein ALC57_13817, partial [Trachymyrmex cornetzi]
DVTVIRDNELIEFDWYPTFSGRYLIFWSQHPVSQKLGTIARLVDRVVLLSNPKCHFDNLCFVIKVLLENDYPLSFVFENINNRLKNIIMASNRKNVVNINNNETRLRQLMVFPHVKSISNKITNVINKADYLIGFRCINKLNKFIKSQKDKDELVKNNNVIYKINCDNCNASYVGQTKRQLQTRIKEHRNNIRLDQSNHSVITKHIKEYNHTFNWEDVKIVDSESNYKKRNISEMIHIKEQKNGLNLMKDTELLDKAYLNILDDIRK